MSDFIGEMIVAFVVTLLPDRAIKWVAWIGVIIIVAVVIVWLSTPTTPPEPTH